MTHTKTALRSALIAVTLFLVSPLHAAGFGNTAVKPLQGISFEYGDEHGVGYFVNDNGVCGLVLTLAAGSELAPSSPGFTSRRIETRIDPTKSFRFYSSNGKILEFSCGSHAQSVHVTGLAELASVAPN